VCVFCSACISLFFVCFFAKTRKKINISRVFAIFLIFNLILFNNKIVRGGRI